MFSWFTNKRRDKENEYLKPTPLKDINTVITSISSLKIKKKTTKKTKHVNLFSFQVIPLMLCNLFLNLILATHLAWSP